MLDNKILSMKNEIIKALQESVKIRSVEDEAKPGMPFGEGVYKALEQVLELSKELGFKVVNLDNMIGYAEHGEGKEMVAVLGHIDVVPEGNGWNYPPYGAEIHDGKIYGRGTLDNKGPIIGALYALKAIRDLNISLSRRVRIIFGTNEESGSKCVKHYVERDEIPVLGFTPDAEYPIINAEKGIVTTSFVKKIEGEEGKIRIKTIKGGTAANVVPAKAEATLVVDEELLEITKENIDGLIKSRGYNIDIEVIKDLKEIHIISHGVSAHGSTPELGKNAIIQLLFLLGNLEINKDSKDFTDTIKKLIGLETNGKMVGIDIEDSVSGKLTLNLGTIKGDSSEIRFDMNIRYPVTKTYEDFMPLLQSKMKENGIAMESVKHKEPLYVPEDEELIQKLQKVYRQKTGEEPKLLAIGGGTYAKSMKNIVAFGPIFPGEPDTIHQPDEYITVDNLIKNTQIMAAAIYELAK